MNPFWMYLSAFAAGWEIVEIVATLSKISNGEDFLNFIGDVLVFLVIINKVKTLWDEFQHHSEHNTIIFAIIFACVGLISAAIIEERTGH